MISMGEVLVGRPNGKTNFQLEGNIKMKLLEVWIDVRK
jgi:hypothetical protein